MTAHICVTTEPIFMKLEITSISANANGPCNADSRQIDQIILPSDKEHWSTANCYTDQEMSVLTYLNDNAQTPLGQFAFNTPKFATFTVTN